MDDYIADDTDAWWGMLDNPETMLTVGSLGDFTPEQLNNFGFEVTGTQTGLGGYGVTDDDGNTLVVDANGRTYLTDPSGKTINASDAKYKTVGPGLFDKFTKALSTPAGMLTAGRALYGLFGSGDQPRAAGYQGTIPKLTAVREQIKQPDYTPYTGQATMGRRFFTDSQYAADKDLAAAKTAAQAQAGELQKAIPTAPDAATAPNPNVTGPVLAKESTTATGILKDFLDKSNSGYYDERAGRILAEAPEKTNADVLKEMQRVAASDPNNPLLKFLPPEIRPSGPSDMGPPVKEKPNVTTPIDPEQSLVQPIVSPNRPGEVEELMRSYTGAQAAIPAAQGDQMMAIGQPVTSMSTKVAGAAQGGIMQLAKGRYLRGGTDGMSDKIPSSIDGVQPAALSHGEFVIPADVVSHLGNGNSDAGADQLYKMMDRVRKDRTGTTKQGKKINPDQYLGGGIAGYASGGIAKFTTGGSSSLSALSPSASNPFGSTATTTLAPYIGDYATGMLGKAQALAQEPYQGYQGPLTAGYSPLQQQAFTAAENINPQATFGTSNLQQYMNPYTQLSLQPQLDEMRRQADISQQNIQGQFSKAGAFGGAREAIARAENLRNLQTAQSGIIGRGFENAFNQAMGQYNIGRQQQLSDVGALAGLGAQQRGIEQEGIAALQKQFEEERMDPFTKLRFQQSMMQGLPIGTTSMTPNLSDMQRTGISLKQATDMYEILKNIPGFADAIKP